VRGLPILAGPAEQIAGLASARGLELVGIAPARSMPQVRRRMHDAVAAGRMATMGWMGGDRPAIAGDPRRLEPAARSVVVVAAPYAGRDDRAAWDARPRALDEALRPVLARGPAGPAGLIARYAIGTDYHVALRDRLAHLADDLRAAGLEVLGTSLVDDRPLAERAVAAAAGLGWIGKNTNLLTRLAAGSWVLLGALLVADALPASGPMRGSCGSCTRCLTGCPTGALIGPRTIDARRCISYLTIEHPGPFTPWEARALGTWIFGCDVCQEVCPVNREADDAGPLRVPLLSLAEWLLPLGGRPFERAVGASALRRAGRHRLLRNTLAALANAAEGPRLPGSELRRATTLARDAARDGRPEVRREARRLAEALGG
jgi:epoxyqueuosine reductase